MLFIYNFNLNLAATGALGMGANIWYLRTIVHVEVLHQFEFFFSDVENTETLDVDYYTLIGEYTYARI